MGTFSIGHLLMVLLVIILLFGTRKLRNLGSDLGSAIKSFRHAMQEGEKEENSTRSINSDNQSKVIEGQLTDKQIKSNN